MRVLITGASGFLGRHLLPLLSGHEVVSLVHWSAATERSDQIVGDLTRNGDWQEEIKRFAPDCCVHLAWQGLPDYSLERCRENLDAGVRLLETLVDSKVNRVVIAGSCWEYGRMFGLVREDAACSEYGVFAATKHALRTIAESVAREGGFEYRWARVFFAYGPGQRSTSLIPYLRSACAAGNVPELRDPQAVQDFVHVVDVARAVQSLAEMPGPSGIFNIGSGQPTPISRVASLVAEHFGRPAAVEDAGTGVGLWADTNRIATAFGWHPTIDIEEGVETMLAALEDQHGAA